MPMATTPTTAAVTSAAAASAVPSGPGPIVAFPRTGLHITPRTPTHRIQLPSEVLSHILSYLAPSLPPQSDFTLDPDLHPDAYETKTGTGSASERVRLESTVRRSALARCMRANKHLASVVAPVLYGKMYLALDDIGVMSGLAVGNGQLGYDSGLSVDVLGVDMEAMLGMGQEEVVIGADGRTGCERADRGGGRGQGPLKQCLLSLTTELVVDVSKGQMHYSERLREEDAAHLKTRPLLPNLDTLIVRLSVGFDNFDRVKVRPGQVAGGAAVGDSTWIWPSPAVNETDKDKVAVAPLAYLTPRSFVLHGASMKTCYGVQAFVPDSRRLSIVHVTIRAPRERAPMSDTPATKLSGDGREIPSWVDGSGLLNVIRDLTHHVQVESKWGEDGPEPMFNAARAADYAALPAVQTTFIYIPPEHVSRRTTTDVHAAPHVSAETHSTSDSMHDQEDELATALHISLSSLCSNHAMRNALRHELSGRNAPLTLRDALRREQSEWIIRKTQLQDAWERCDVAMRNLETHGVGSVDDQGYALHGCASEGEGGECDMFNSAMTVQLARQIADRSGRFRAATDSVNDEWARWRSSLAKLGIALDGDRGGRNVPSKDSLMGVLAELVPQRTAWLATWEDAKALVEWLEQIQRARLGSSNDACQRPVQVCSLLVLVERGLLEVVYCFKQVCDLPDSVYVAIKAAIDSIGISHTAHAIEDARIRLVGFGALVSSDGRCLADVLQLSATAGHEAASAVQVGAGGDAVNGSYHGRPDSQAHWAGGAAVSVGSCHRCTTDDDPLRQGMAEYLQAETIGETGEDSGLSMAVRERALEVAQRAELCCLRSWLEGSDSGREVCEGDGLSENRGAGGWCATREDGRGWKEKLVRDALL